MGGGSGGGLPAGSACDAAAVPHARTWRLTHAQYRNTVMAVFGFVGPTVAELPEEGQPDGFANQADRLTVPALLATKYLAATDEIAANVAGRSGEFIKCPLSSLGGACLREFLTTTGTRAWRRPLTPAELDKYTKLFTDVAAGNGAETAFKGVVQALLLSPNFLFRTELGNGPGKDGVVALTDYELASAVSYMLLDGPPDAQLMQAAADGKLRDPAALAAEAKRLLGGKTAAASLGAFFRQWLQFDTLSANKDAMLFPTYTPELVNDLIAENQAFVEGVLFDPAGDHDVKTLFTAGYGYVNARTAPLYGVQATGNDLKKVNLPAAQRRGFLTSAAFISGASDSAETNLPARGRIVREQVLCEEVAPPAGNFTLDDPKFTPDMTAREKFAAHTTNPSCAACHELFDGIGFALEQYDPIGRFRTMDKAKTIDATGELPLSDTTLKFSSYVELIDQIAKRPETFACVASQYNAYATGRPAAGMAACERDAVNKAFTEGGYKLEALVAAVVTSPTFAVRRN